MTRPDTDQKLATDVSTMFDEVSPRYDLINDVLSAGNSRLWRIALTRALQPRKGMRILDVAAGTGTSSAAIAAGGAHVTAADFSEGMLAEGRRRQSGNELIEFVYADASRLPFEDDSFDAATISFGLRNVSDPKQALAEMRRVVKPGGRIVICEFSRPVKSLRKPYSVYSRHVLPRIAGVINKSSEDAYRYLNESIEQWPAQDQLAEWLREAGLERVAYRNLTFGIVALHRGYVPREKTVAKVKPTAATKPQDIAKSGAAKTATKSAGAVKAVAKMPAVKPKAAAQPKAGTASTTPKAPAKSSATVKKTAAKSKPSPRLSTEPSTRATSKAGSTATKSTSAQQATAVTKPATKPAAAAKTTAKPKTATRTAAKPTQKKTAAKIAAKPAKEPASKQGTKLGTKPATKLSNKANNRGENE